MLSFNLHVFYLFIQATQAKCIKQMLNGRLEFILKKVSSIGWSKQVKLMCVDLIGWRFLLWTHLIGWVELRGERHWPIADHLSARVKSRHFHHVFVLKVVKGSRTKLVNRLVKESGLLNWNTIETRLFELGFFEHLIIRIINWAKGTSGVFKHIFTMCEGLVLLTSPTRLK